MSLDPSEEFFNKYGKRPNGPRGNRWLIVGAAAVLIAIAFIAGKMTGQPKQAISADDALTYINAQVKMNEIGQKFNKDIKPIQDKAEADAAPYRKTLVELQKKVCKANAMSDDCEIDPLARTVKAKAKGIPTAPIGK